MRDIQKMGLDKAMFLVLGHFQNKILSAKTSESVLCLGEMGTKKTSSVAIPSVLRSDNASIVAVDMTGILLKYTAGHRAKLGPVFYYNWDLLDDAEKGLFYPRWNPLAGENLPKNSAQKEAYLRRIAGYLVRVEELDDGDYWNLLTQSVISSFFGYWTSKVSQAQANDYFLTRFAEGKHLSRAEKDILLSFYLQMPPSLTKDVVQEVEDNSLSQENYLPIGSWGGLPEQWMGKEVCFAAITDWLIVNYLTMQDEGGKDWRGWISSLIQEAVVFGYGAWVVDGLQQLLRLSAKQRQIVLACAIKPFRIFVHQALRERTNGNHFNLDNLRGVYDEALHDWRPVTIYSMSNTHASKVLNQMFLDEALYRSMYMNEKQGPLPEVFVLDDVGHNLKLKNLTAALETGKSKKIATLLLCNNLDLIENVYSREELEQIVVHTSYKVIKASDNKQLSRHLDKLAFAATKSVQIPRLKKTFLKKKKFFADAAYFHQLALIFRLNKNLKMDVGNYQIVLAEGYYNCPILAQNLPFYEDERFKKEAVLDADYTLSQERIQSDFDEETPKITEVFNQKDLGVDDLVELDQYMDMVFDEVLRDIKKTPKKEDLQQEKHEESFFSEKEVEIGRDWWMEEKAFEVKEKDKENPFNPSK